jgi:quinohemoprotein ethanol dehydrogenase
MTTTSRSWVAWTQKLDWDFGVEATPIVVDGVMYTTGAYSIVYAYDARTGQRCGSTTRRCRATRAARAAAAWSTVVWPSGRARSMWGPSTAG